MHIELDGKQVVDALHGDKNSFSNFGIFISKCKNIVHLNTIYRIGFVKRQTKQVSHCLTRTSRLFASSKIFNFIPSCMVILYLNELI